ncbi:MAG: hypothetical protein IJI03_12365 [Rudaea sp.]|nr:hypothetical protein [Rudaea sp.]
MPITSLAYAPYAPVGVTATSAQPNYPATNALTTSIQRPWRSNTTTGESITLDLGSSKTVACIAFSACNFFNYTLRADNSAIPTTVIASAATGADDQSRFKGSITPAAPITVRYISITPTGAPTDGAAGYSIGAIYVFPAAPKLARDPLFGVSQIDTNAPQSLTVLDNGATIKDDIGIPYAEITLGFSGGTSDDFGYIFRAGHIGLMWLNLDGTNTTGRQWPVRYFEPKMSRKLQMFNREQVQFVLKEQV